MKHHLITLLASVLTTLFTVPMIATAQDQKTHQGHHEATKPTATTDTSDMTNAEVRKVDKAAKKITLKHEAIKSLDMPGMTMVFQVVDTALLDKVQAGDKVKFKAKQDGSAYVVTDLVPEK
ncbi:MAG: copper-binding protein [Burkholderiales bacterium]|nr:copper-binding protein [Burkholderiales bacterium]